MSSPAVPIPGRKAAAGPGASSSLLSSYSSSTASSSFPDSNGSGTSSSSTLLPSLKSSKGKARATDSPESSPSVERIAPRRPSLLGNSLSKSEYTVINLADSDGPPRLVTCVKSEQGWDWNQDLFLPSYANHDGHDLEHKPDPVEEIVLTDEEAEAMLP